MAIDESSTAQVTRDGLRPEPVIAPEPTARREENRARPKGLRRLKGPAAQLGQIGVGLVALVVVWDLAVRVLDVPSYVLPQPLEVVAAIREQWSIQLWDHTWITLLESLGGYLIAIVVSLPLAILLTYSKVADRILFPVLVVFQVIPKIALAPLFIIWLGFGMFPKVLISFLVAFFAIVVSTTVGLKSTKPEMVDLARSMGASTLQVFLKVRLPNSLPTFFGGLKVGVTLAVIGAIVGEFVGSGAGLGYLLIVAMSALNLPLVFASILMMAAIGIVMYGAVDVTERLAIPWQRSSELDRVHGAA